VRPKLGLYHKLKDVVCQEKPYLAGGLGALVLRGLDLGPIIFAGARVHVTRIDATRSHTCAQLLLLCLPPLCLLLQKAVAVAGCVF
jgi:hypothetical protein